MAYEPHLKTRPQVIADTAVGVLDEELLIPQLFTNAVFDQKNYNIRDTVNVKVPGLLPARSYALDNDRSQALQFDTYSEHTVPMTFDAGRLYSAVAITDEQNDFDQITVNDLIPVQTRAVAKGMEYHAAAVLDSARYEVAVTNAENDIYTALVRARSLLRKFRSQGTRNLLIGTDFEAALLLDKRFTTHVSVGDEAPAVLRSGNIGNWLGFNIYVSELVAPDEAIAFTDAAFAAIFAAPSIPTSVPFGASASAYGKSLRWIRDYDSMHVLDRSIVDSYFGAKQILDYGQTVIDTATIDEAKSAAPKGVNTVAFAEKIIEGEFNVRSFKISLGADTPTGLADAGENQEFLLASKITDGDGLGVNTIDIPAPSA